MFFFSKFEGALTSKPYAFSVRPWEVESSTIIDPLEPSGISLRVDTRGGNPFRALPADESAGWIADRSRFLYDGFRRQRLLRPLLRLSTLQRFQPVSWSTFLQSVSKLGSAPLVVGGPFLNFETTAALKQLGLSWQLRPKGGVDSTFDGGNLFRFNSSSLLSSDLLLLIGGGVRTLSPLLHLKVQRRVRQGVLSVSLGGSALSGGLQLSRTTAALLRLTQGRHRLAAALLAAVSPVVLLSPALLGRPDHFSLFRLLQLLPTAAVSLPLPTWGAHNAALTAVSFPLLPTSRGPAEWCWLLSADGWSVAKEVKSVLYQGHHGDRGASSATLLFPVLAPYEESAPYSICDLAGRPLPLSAPLPSVEPLPTSLEAVTAIAALNSNRFRQFRSEEGYVGLCAEFDFPDSGLFGRLHSSPLYPAAVNPYQLDPISRSSRPLALASVRLVARSPNYTQFDLR